MKVEHAFLFVSFEFSELQKQDQKDETELVLKLHCWATAQYNNDIRKMNVHNWYKHSYTCLHFDGFDVMFYLFN